MFVRNKTYKYYDKKRLKELRLKEGDKVFLVIRNFKLKRLSKKLDFKKTRLFKITKKILILNYELAFLKTI